MSAFARVALAFFLGVAQLPAALAQDSATAPAAVASDLLPFASDEGLARLSRSDARVNFPALANQFEAEYNGAFCGPTSAAIVLNALRADDARVEKPEDPSLVPTGVRASLPKGFDPLYHRYTQNDLFTPAAERVKTRNAVLGAPSARGTRPASS